MTTAPPVIPIIVDHYQETYHKEDDHFTDGLDKYRVYQYDYPVETEFLDCQIKLQGKFA